jgi:DDE superfamily endonuclease
MLVLLKYYGCDGNQSASRSLSSFFAVSNGIVDSCRNNALEALLSLKEKIYFWPDAHERRVIAKRIKDKYKFPHCIGLIDGTLLPLSTKPLLHGENYLSRKQFYAIVMLVVCDDIGHILYYHIGWPGSVHDNCVWRNCRLSKHPEKHFSKRQYLLGDSAFTASAIMIPPFKSSAGGRLSNNRTAFNTLLAKPPCQIRTLHWYLKRSFPLLAQHPSKVSMLR